MNDVVKFADMFPNVTKGESRLFLKFLLKNNLYDRFMERGINGKVSGASGFTIIKGVNLFDSPTLTALMYQEWSETYRKTYFEKTLKEWEYHVLEIMTKHDIPFSQYIEDQYVLYAPYNAKSSIRKYIDKRFSKRLSYFTESHLSFDFRGQSWLRVAFTMKSPQ